VAWEAARVGDLACADQLVASISDQEWRGLGLYAIHVQRDAPPDIPTQHDARLVAHPRSEKTSSTTDAERLALDLLCQVDARPDDPSASRLLAEAMRAGPCMPALTSLSLVDPSAALAAGDMLLKLLI
jgi:hypothetical protein